MAQSPRGLVPRVPQAALANSPHTHRLDAPQPPPVDRFWHSGAFARLVPEPRTLTDNLLSLAIDTQDAQNLEDVVEQLNRLGIHQAR